MTTETPISSTNAFSCDNIDCFYILLHTNRRLSLPDFAIEMFSHRPLAHSQSDFVDLEMTHHPHSLPSLTAVVDPTTAHLAFDYSCLQGLDEETLYTPTDAFAAVCWSSAVYEPPCSPRADDGFGKQQPPAHIHQSSLDLGDDEAYYLPSPTQEKITVDLDMFVADDTKAAFPGLRGVPVRGYSADFEEIDDDEAQSASEGSRSPTVEGTFNFGGAKTDMFNMNIFPVDTKCNFSDTSSDDLSSESSVFEPPWIKSDRNESPRSLAPQRSQTVPFPATGSQESCSEPSWLRSDPSESFWRNKGRPSRVMSLSSVSLASYFPMLRKKSKNGLNF